MASPQFVRPLGAIEEMFAAYSELGCATFTIVAEIYGNLTTEHLKASLNTLQHYRKKLGFQIHCEPGDRRYFVSSDKDMDLKVLSSESTTWEEAVAEELVTPFGELEPLFRLAMLQREMTNTLMLTFHHSIADGISGVQMLGDLLRVLSGERLAVERQEGDTLEDWLGGEFRAAVDKTGSSMPAGSFPGYRKWAVKVSQPPMVRSVILPRETTTRIIDKARSERTTVHAALITAMAQSRHRLAPGTCPKSGLRLMTPINVRPFIRPTSRESSPIGVYISESITVSQSVGSYSDVYFWEEARTVYESIFRDRTKAAVINLAAATEKQMRLDASAWAVTEFMRTAMDHEGLLSNLGKLDLDEVYGKFRVLRVWGPALRTCIEGEDNIGATTIAGRLHLVHTSTDGTDGLLQRMVELLERI